MSTLLLAALAAFTWSANRRWQLLKIGRPEDRAGDLPARLRATMKFAIAQQRMKKYPLAGFAHILIFSGFMVLLLRSLVLFGRGFDADFDLWVLAPGTAAGDLYGAVKDFFVLAVLAGALVFAYLRAVKRLDRLTRSFEAALILGIIVAMMLADALYDGAELALANAKEGVAFSAIAPAGSLAGALLAGLDLRSGTLETLMHVGFWTHVTLVLLFLNVLPHSKHFHVITAIPNVFALDLGPRGRLRPVPDIEDRVGEDKPVGVRTIEDLTWKGILDLYTCTECGRCTDNCPASKTGKLLSPKHLTLALRDHLYGREDELVEGRWPEPEHVHGEPHGEADAHADHGGLGHDEPPAAMPPKPIVIERKLVDLVPSVISPEVLWACTTCRACEEECPVLISYVDKIVDMRRDLVTYGKHMPADLQKPFDGMESNGNPWSFARMDRTAWTEGLGVRTMKEHPKAEVLFWVGCAASYDDRAKKIARATARLMTLAKVDFAILGAEESCTGDAARRAGNEYLFQTLAQKNVETLGRYGVKKIVTTCPHCFNTLGNEYPDFGGKYEVVHHTVFLQDLLSQGKLVPRRSVAKKVVFHDSCYLGRYNDVYAPPRKVLGAIPGIELVEARDGTGRSAALDRGLCCGAGGAQFWKEEEHGKVRVSTERTDQLLATGAGVIASGCPFCQTMILDGVKARDREDVEELDVAEILERAIDPDSPFGVPAALPKDPRRLAPAAAKGQE
ncbi:MAG: (Fe-S)-binding protein [Deltaproteobacteria bacterium]|nr:(Fe-S)-binding protein [Deltaproteobacteria bacterium]